MIQKETFLRCLDNSGVNIVKCIRLFGGLKKNSKIGDMIIVVVKYLRHNKQMSHKLKSKSSKLKKKNKVLALIIGIKNKTRRGDGSFFSCDRNKVVLVGKSGNVLGTRIYGFIPKEICWERLNKKYDSVVAMSKYCL